MFDDTRTIMEPAGALAVAGLKAWAATHDVAGARLVAVLSGANMNFDRLRFVAERAEIGEAREALCAVTIPERPGAFREFCTALGRRVITEFNYRLSRREPGPHLRGLRDAVAADAQQAFTSLRAAGYEVMDLSGSELAKLHLRYMVGGLFADVRDERCAASSFRNGPGALLQFLDTLGGRWNISLFHYRNHGADVGRGLAGFEVPPALLRTTSSASSTCLATAIRSTSTKKPTPLPGLSPRAET